MKYSFKEFKDWFKDLFDYQKFEQETTSDSEKTNMKLVGSFISFIVYGIIFKFLLDSYKNGIIIGFIVSLILNLAIKRHSFYFAMIAFMAPVGYILYLVIAVFILVVYFGFHLFSWLWNQLPN